MTETLDASRLKAKFDELGGDVSEDVWLRIRRALSWIERAEAEIKRAEQEGKNPDDDVCIIFLWIAFNAAYARDDSTADKAKERDTFRMYLRKIVELDREDRIYKTLKKHRGPAQRLVENKFIFQPFWDSHGKGFHNWEQKLEESKTRLQMAFRSKSKGSDKRVKILELVFDQLYTLRNQLFHGGAAWESEVNRAQVTKGAEILVLLMPIFVDIMMVNPERDWGKPFYPRAKPLD